MVASQTDLSPHQFRPPRTMRAGDRSHARAGGVEPPRCRDEQRPGRLAAQGAGKEVSLAVLASQLAEVGELTVRLDPLGNDVQAQALRQGDDRPHDLRVLAADADPGDKRTINL